MVIEGSLASCETTWFVLDEMKNPLTVVASCGLAPCVLKGCTPASMVISAA